ncbi:GFA family protein [Parendozoicomonas sp. Alg238-R29]|uniref:GFA family protein n=1 Tax=Parendozoicomonas sp. Alg238-R29 TaxID=2993446 RepID=UPI00248F3230|nr:GFA family protein [Parendozoicomonas sp. Alg238-R29]
MAKIKGSCRCGQLKYQITDSPVLSGFCHCYACQKRTNAPCAAFAMVKKNTFNPVGSSLTYKDKGGSGAPLLEHRCSECGTIVYTELKVLDGIYAVSATTYTDSSQFDPSIHVWVSSQDKRFQINDNLHQEAGPPKALFKFIAKEKSEA